MRNSKVKLTWARAEEHVIFNLVITCGAQTTTAQLCPDRDTFEFDQGHVTKNQPITMLVLLSESLGL